MDEETKELVLRMTREGIITSKSATRRLTEEKVDKILELETLPMYVNDQFLDWLEDKEVDCAYKMVEVTKEFPAFRGTDGQIVEGFEVGDKITVPQANGEIIRNKGLGEFI